jgi:putative ABC transport system substrate-binding protein
MEGRNLAIDLHHIESSDMARKTGESGEAHANRVRKVEEMFTQRAREVVETRPDVICVSGTHGAAEISRMRSDVPIVFFNVADPVRSGLVESYRRPGGNVTGIGNRWFDLVGKRVELLIALRPRARSLAVIGDYRGDFGDIVREEVDEAARRFGLRVAPVNSALDHDGLVQSLRSANADAILHLTSNISTSFLKLLRSGTVPAVYMQDEPVRRGGLMSLGATLKDQALRAVDVAVRILRGEKPATIPVELLEKPHLVINRATARAQRIQIPSSVLLQADEVIE